MAGSVEDSARPIQVGSTMIVTKPNIPTILSGDFVLPKIADINIQKTLADLSPEPPPNLPDVVPATAKPPFLMGDLSSRQSPGLKFVQLVLEQPPTAVQQQQQQQPGKRPVRKKTKECREGSEGREPPAGKPSEPINDVCTICGERYVEKAAFNAHIRAHLKEKLSTKIERSQQQKKLQQSLGQQGAVPRQQEADKASSSKRKLDYGTGGHDHVKSKIKVEVADHCPKFAQVFETSSDLCTSDDLLLSGHLGQLEVPLVGPKQVLCTPDISDEDDFLNCEFSAQMEINRVDLNNDLSLILDQIEKDFEGPSINLSDVNLDTPPDSDSEASTDYLSMFSSEDQEVILRSESLLHSRQPSGNTNQSKMLMVSPRLAECSDIELKSTTTLSDSLVNIEGFLEADGGVATDHDYLLKSPRHSLASATATPARLGVSLSGPVVQGLAGAVKNDPDKYCAIQAALGNGRPSSTIAGLEGSGQAAIGQLGLTKFAALPAKAIAVLNQLPGKLLLQKGAADSKVVNVFKVEKTGACQITSSPSPAVINVECVPESQRGEKAAGVNIGANIANAKIIETTKGADGEKEYKIVLGVDRDVPKPKTVSAKSKQSAECSVCGKSITTKNMARHMEKHTGKKKFQCDICQASFFQKTHLKNHGILHENGEYHECKECKQKFLRKADFQRHQKNVHNIHSMEVQFACQICGTKFSEPQKLEIHKKAHVRDKKELCGVCGQKLGDRLAMVAHMKQHTEQDGNKPFTCNVCQKTFTQRGHLNRHAKSHADLVCLVCNKQCKNKVSFVRHRTTHVVCTICSTVFDNKSQLQQHTLTYHPASPPKGFLSPASLSSPPDLSFLDEDESNCSVAASPLDVSSGQSTSSSPSGSGLDLLDVEQSQDFGYQFTDLMDDCQSLLYTGDKSLARMDELDYSQDLLGESLDHISDTSFFDISRQMNDEICSTDLFDDVK